MSRVRATGLDEVTVTVDCPLLVEGERCDAEVEVVLAFGTYTVPFSCPYCKADYTPEQRERLTEMAKDAYTNYGGPDA